MSEKLIREWKKVFAADLAYVAHEMKDAVNPKALILLDGPMGAGKTTFAKTFISDDETFSPSYAVLSETNTVLHADFYRLKNSDEIYHLELPLYLEDKNYFLVEWGKAFTISHFSFYRRVARHFSFSKKGTLAFQFSSCMQRLR